MNNSLNRLIDGIIIALEREIIPRVDDAYARGQAFAVMDLLRNMRPRLEWSREVTLAQVGLQEAALTRVEDLCGGQAERPPAYAPPSAASSTLDTKELEARRDRLEAEICGVLKWLTEHRPCLDSTHLDSATRKGKPTWHASSKTEPPKSTDSSHRLSGL